MSRSLVVSKTLSIPFKELRFTYTHSSGPGGQNVNKVNTKAVLHWNVRDSHALSEETRAWLLTRLAKDLSHDGALVFSSDRLRDRPRNVEDCLEKLVTRLKLALSRPKPRKKTKPPRASVKRAKEAKRRLSEKKTMRRKPR